MHYSVSTGLLALTLFHSTSAALLSERASNRTALLTAYYGQTANQDRLRTFCDDDSIDIFPIGFVNGFPSDPGNNGYPETNFGNQCGGYYANTKTFLSCPQLIEDVAYCQARGKKILVSIGGGISSGKLTSDTDATNFANQLWQIFGPKPCGYTGPRPFGDNVVDGFDFDIEQNGSTGVAALAAGLRTQMDSDASKTYLLTAAPQCPIPDAQLGLALSSVRFDYVWVQFYNTAACSARAFFDHSFGPDINFNAWVSWLKANSPSTPPKLFIGLPASPAAANSDYYLSLTEVEELLKAEDSADIFGGVMLYDAMYSRENSINNQTYASNVHALLDAEGFQRAPAVANNGYIYRCSNSTTPPISITATSTSSSISLSTSTFVFTNSTMPTPTTSIIVSSSSPVMTASCTPIFVTITVTTPVVSSASLTSSIITLLRPNSTVALTKTSSPTDTNSVQTFTGASSSLSERLSIAALVVAFSFAVAFLGL